MNLRNTIDRADSWFDLLHGKGFELEDLFRCEPSNEESRNWKRIDFLSCSLIDGLAYLVDVEQTLTMPYRVVDSKCFGDIDLNVMLVPDEDADSRRM